MNWFHLRRIWRGRSYIVIGLNGKSEEYMGEQQVRYWGVHLDPHYHHCYYCIPHSVESWHSYCMDYSNSSTRSSNQRILVLLRLAWTRGNPFSLWIFSPPFQWHVRFTCISFGLYALQGPFMRIECTCTRISFSEQPFLNIFTREVFFWQALPFFLNKRKSKLFNNDCHMTPGRKEKHNHKRRRGAN